MLGFRLSELGGSACQRKLPNTTRRLRNIIPMRLTTMGKRPSTMRQDIMRRVLTTLIRHVGTQRTPDTTVKKPPRLTPRNTGRNNRPELPASYSGAGRRRRSPQRLSMGRATPIGLRSFPLRAKRISGSRHQKICVSSVKPRTAIDTEMATI